MTELDLYKFIHKNEVEIDWRGDGLLAWLSPYNLKEFSDLLDRCNADDGGLPCQLQEDGIIVLSLSDVCEEYDINPENIVERDSHV